MSLVLSTSGELEVLQKLLTTQDFTLKLYISGPEPILPANVAGDFTELSGFGYSDKPLTSGNWTFSGAAPTLASYPVQAFLFSGAAGKIMGYFVVDQSGTLIWAEQFAEVPNIQSNLDKILFTPTISSRSLVS